MKKFLTMIALMVVALLAVGCSNNDETTQTEEGKAGTTLKTGYAIISSVDKSTDASLAQTDSTAVIVLVDEQGIIVKCAIDGVQTKISFDSSGKITTPMNTLVPTKTELGKEYGMSKVSSLGKDWDEQIAAFAAYVEGKTVEEVKGIAIDEKTAPTDDELKTSVTMSIGSYIAAIDQAVANATDMGAKSGDFVGVGISTNIAKSKNAEVGVAGLAQAYSTYTLTSFDADGKITSCIIDGSQCNVNFDQTGKISTDLKAMQKSKNQLKEEYGMKKASSIGKEWYEQAAAYAKYVTGKTVEEVKGVAVNEEGAPSDEELKASVTVSVGDFNSCLEKAFAVAR